MFHRQSIYLFFAQQWNRSQVHKDICNNVRMFCIILFRYIETLMNADYFDLM